MWTANTLLYLYQTLGRRIVSNKHYAFFFYFNLLSRRNGNEKITILVNVFSNLFDIGFPEFVDLGCTPTDQLSGDDNGL